MVSLYLDQIPDQDIGLAFAAEHNIPVFDTVGEALTLGGTGIAVDGVVLIGEHGDYPVNGRGQLMYPRRRLFDSAIAAMVAGGRFVPVFTDKHFSWSYRDAERMFRTAKRLGVPLLAGSSVPLLWRRPAIDWPFGSPMTEAIAVGYGPPESYEFHTLEALQCMVERRKGGETGVVAVHDLPRGSFWGKAAASWSEEVLDAVLKVTGVQDDWHYDARGLLRQAILIEYADGLRASVLRFDRLVSCRAFAGKGEDGILACGFHGDMMPPWRHFGFLVKQMERMFVSGVAPYPAERTLLTTGVLEAAMRSRAAGGVRIETPHLAEIAYTPPEVIPDTGIGFPPPAPSPKDIDLDT
ncbi:MAG: hypothetical protein IT335_11930 [Thermomicrobiales bacterium]|nr:hypothetical protein [Thermomicrobiales bacterium]